ncbi:prephenate dehydrogenase/arogenate dehydrogenase family protein [Thermodesulfobacteriota bacterium]
MAREKATIGIIGGTGKMGRWFGAFFKERGHDVLICGRRTRCTIQDVAGLCRVVILSVPLEAALSLTETVGPLLHEDQVLMDICSLKETITRKMEASTGAEVIGTHPLFGPRAESVRGQNVVVCPARGEAWLQWLRAILEGAGASVVQCDARIHDRKMGLVQGLNHFLTIALALTLREAGETLDDILPFATPIFRLKLDLVGRLFAQDLELYQDLIRKNAHTVPMLETFIREVQKAQGTLLESTDSEAIHLLRELRAFVGQFGRKGLHESDAFLEHIAQSSGRP